MIFLLGLLEKLEDLSDCEPETRVEVTDVPDVTDVLVSSASVVTELCDVSSCFSEWDLVEPHSLSLQKAGLFSYAGRDEVRKLTSESASAIEEMPPTPLQKSYSSF